jgi:hypothetical protein
VVKVLQYSGIIVANVLIVVLSSLMLIFCSAWMLGSAPLAQTMVLIALSMCGSGFAALREPSDRHRQ